METYVRLTSGAAGSAKLRRSRSDHFVVPINFGAVYVLLAPFYVASHLFPSLVLYRAALADSFCGDLSDRASLHLPIIGWPTDDAGHTKTPLQ